MAGKEETTNVGTVVAPTVEAKAPVQAAPDTSQAAASSKQAASTQTTGGEESWAKKLGKGNARELIKEGLVDLVAKTDVETAKVEDATDADEGDGQPQPQPPTTTAAPDAQQQAEVETLDAKIARLEKELADREAKEKTAEREKQAQAALALTQAEQNELRGRVNIIEQQRSLYAELQAEAQEVIEDYGAGSEQAARVQRRLQTAYHSLNGSIYDYNSRLQQIQSSTTSRQMQEVQGAVNATLSEYGVTFEEVRAANPNADMGDFNQVLKGAVKAAVAKEQNRVKAEREKEKATIAKTEQELRDERLKWGQSPGASPDRGIGGSQAGAGGGDVLSQIRSGKSSTQLISEGLKARR